MKKFLRNKTKFLKLTLSICLILISLVILSVLNFYFDWGNNVGIPIVFDIITTITAIFGVIGVVLTLKRNREIEEAQFTLELSNSFINSQDFYVVYDFWDKYSSEQKFNLMNDSDKKELNNIISLTYKYLDFFDPLYVLVEDKIIKISVIERLFKYRFCLIVNNWAVQRYVLNPKGKEHLKNGNFDNILNLYRLIKEYKSRLNNNANVAVLPYSENDLLDFVEEIKSQTTNERCDEKVCVN